MDPLIHLMLPLLFLLAIRVDQKKALLLAPLAILPDLDALFGLHRALGHSFVPILVIPMGFLLYSRYLRPEWVPYAIIAQFYLASHVVMDLGGVAFLWPLVDQQFYFEPEVTFTADGGFSIGLGLDYGMRDLADMGTTSLLSDMGFAMIFLGILAIVMFRKEAIEALRTALKTVVALLARMR